VADIMRTGRMNPQVTVDKTVSDVLLKITQARAGAALIVDGRRRLLGIFTDGDLRRHIESSPGLLQRRIGDVMTKIRLPLRMKRLLRKRCI